MITESYHKTNGRIIRVENTPRYKGLLLQPFEVDLLEQLQKFRVIPAGDLISYYLALRTKHGLKSDRRNTIVKRLTRLADAGVVRRVTRNNRYRMNDNYYLLGERGIDVLRYTQRITEGESEYISNFYRRKETSAPSQHTETTTKLGLMIQESIMQLELNDLINVQRGNRHELLGNQKDTQYETKNLIIPDLTIDVGEDTIIAIEVDSGRQHTDVLKNKHKRYSKFMQSKVSQGKELYVVYVPIDDVLSGDETVSNKTRRIQSIKNIFPEYNEWPDGMHVYVLRAIEVMEFVVRVYNRIEARSFEQEEGILQEWSNELQLQLKAWNYEINQLSEYDISPTNRTRNMSTPPLCLSIQRGNKQANYYYVYRACAGSIRSYQMYLGAVAKCAAINRDDFSKYNVRILMVYWNPDTMMNDVIVAPKEESVEVIGTTISELNKVSQEVLTPTLEDFALYNITSKHAFLERKKQYSL